MSNSAAPFSAPPANFYDGANYAPSEGIGQLLFQVSLAMRRHIESRMGEHGLTAAQWGPLWLLKIGSARSAQELTCLLGVDAGAVTRLLDRLEVKGLVARTRSQTDRRVVQLSLTDAGEAAVAHVPWVLADVNNQFLSGFSADEWQQLKHLLKRMIAAGAAPVDSTDRPERSSPLADSP